MRQECQCCGESKVMRQTRPFDHDTDATCCDDCAAEFDKSGMGNFQIFMHQRVPTRKQIVTLLLEFFKQDRCKVALWLRVPNPNLGATPWAMIRMGRSWKLLKWIQARLDENKPPEAATVFVCGRGMKKPGKKYKCTKCKKYFQDSESYKMHLCPKVSGQPN